MGVRPPKISDMFKHTAIDIEKDHDVPIENFLNAQCMYGAPGSSATADKDSDFSEITVGTPPQVSLMPIVDASRFL